MLFGNKKKHSGIIFNNMDESKNYAEWKKLDKKEYILYTKFKKMWTHLQLEKADEISAFSRTGMEMVPEG